MCDDNNIEKMDDGTDDVISETEENMDETVVDADAEPAETEAESDEVEDDGCFSEYAQEMFLETYLSIPTRDRNILDLLEDRYDFRLLEKEGVPEAYNFEVESEFHIFADTSSGDVYGFIGGVGSFENDVFPIGFVSADHRVERIASNLWEFFSIIIACPFWERLLPVEPEERAEKAGQWNEKMAGEIPDYREIQEVLASVFDVDLENMEAITSYLTRNTSMESGLVVKPLKKKKGFMSFFK